jgi:dethiobiotin synthetase
VTGTDTGVGKTFITAALARLLRRQGQDVGVCKPVATGATQVRGRWLAEDTRLLAEAAGCADHPERVTPWTFPDPVAQPVAARRQGVALTLAAIVRAVHGQARPQRLLLVEGVGGLLCPLTAEETVADLAAALGFPLVIVARRALGTLNHTLLTLEAARTRGLRVAGVVVNETTRPDSLAEATNVEELRRRIDVPLLAIVPFQAGLDSADVPALAAVDWRRLAGAQRAPTH